MATDSDSSASENDENLTKLLESTDKEFLNDSLYKQKQDSTNEEGHKKIPSLPSLRKSKDEDEDYNFFKVTPGFREYVARNLDKRIEKMVKYTQRCDNSAEEKKKSDRVKLFRDSIDFLTIENESVAVLSTAAHNESGRRERLKNISETVDYEKIRSVAVSPEDILNQKGTEHWSYKSKVSKYQKAKDGTLISVD